MKLCICFGICLLSNWFYLRLSFFFFFSFIKPWAENGLTNQFSSIHSLSHVWRFMTPWTAAHQASLSITNSLLKLMSIESVMLSHHVILCRPLLLLHLIFPSIRVFSGEWVLHIRWPKCMSFGFSISTSNDIQDWYHVWFHLLAVQGTLKRKKRKKEKQKTELLSAVYGRAWHAFCYPSSEMLLWRGRREGGGRGNTCKSMTDSCQCMTETTTIL